MSATSIGWTELTLNPVIGCTHAAYQGQDGKKVAHPGCQNCYAETMCNRKLPGFEAHNRCSTGGKWTGKIEVLHERLSWPFTRKEYKPRRDGEQRRCFLTSLSDMGHPGLAEADWMAVQGMMLLAPWLTWQDLTKRPEHQRALLEKYSPSDCVAAFRGILTTEQSEILEAHAVSRWNTQKGKAWSDFRHIHRYVSVSDQATADALIPELLKMPCAVRGVSLEPMIERVTLREWLACNCPGDYAQWLGDDRHNQYCPRSRSFCGKRLDHVIVGGESGRGPKIRPFALEWALDVIEQCKKAGIWVFFKQAGSRPYTEDVGRWEWFDADKPIQFTGKGDNPLEWPESLRVRQHVGMPDGAP